MRYAIMVTSMYYLSALHFPPLGAVLNKKAGNEGTWKVTLLEEQGRELTRCLQLVTGGEYRSAINLFEAIVILVTGAG